MTSPLDSRYLHSPESPLRQGITLSPVSGLVLGDLSRVEQDEIAALRIRISRMQAEQADKAQEYNEDCKKLHLEVAKLRATVEKGEVLKQKVEYELTLAHAASNQEKRKHAEKEASLQKSNASLKDKTVQQANDLERLRQVLETERTERNTEMQKWQSIIAEKDEENSKLKAMNKDLVKTQQQLKEVKNEHEGLIKELQEKCNTLDHQRNAHNDTVRRLMKDLEFSNSQGERLESDLLKAQSKLKEYGENIEAERAAHLETKFNFEILQVRVRDFETVQASLAESRRELENITKDHHELKAAMEDQLEAYSELKSLMAKKDEQYALEVNRVNKELNEKLKDERKLSEQLDIHQENFQALRNELSEAKRHQTDIDATYGNISKELEVLADNFQLGKSNSDDGNGEKKKRKKKSTGAVVENLKSILREYQTRLADVSSSLDKVKSRNDQLTKECQRHKQRASAREKALEEAQNLVKESHLESARYKAECLKYENDLLHHEEQSNRLSKKVGDQKDKHHHLRLEIEDIKDTLHKTQKEHVNFLSTLYQQLITGRLYSHKGASDASFTSTELRDLIYEQVEAKINALRTAEDKVQQLQAAVKSHEKSLEKLQYMYDETVEQVSKSTKDREAEWRKERLEMEEHFKAMLKDVKGRADKSKLHLEEAWAKLDETKQTKDEIQMKSSRFKKLLKESQTEKQCLLAGLALLSGSMQPTYWKIESLIAERSILMKMLRDLIGIRQQVSHLANLLKSEMNEKNGNLRRHAKSKNHNMTLPAILRFRKSVIVILAVNRFYYHAIFRSQHLNVETITPAVGRSSVIVLTPKCSQRTNFQGINDKNRTLQLAVDWQATGVDWLTSKLLSTAVCHSTKALVERLRKLTRTRSGNGDILSQDSADEEAGPTKYDHRTRAWISEAAKNSYLKLNKGIQAELPSSIYCTSNNSGDSLACQLRLGLRSLLRRHTERWKDQFYTSSATIMDLMNSQIIAFIKRLHATELDRKSQRHEVIRLKEEREEIERLLSSEREAKGLLINEDRSLRRRFDELQCRLRDTVEIEKYEAVCEDLSMALKKERQAEQLLAEHTKKLEDIEQRLEVHSEQGIAKDTTIAETLKTLNSAKHEINKRDEAIRSLRKETELAAAERNIAQQNLENLQQSFNRISREREVITNYIRATGTVLEQSRHQARMSSTDNFDFALPELVLPDEILAADGINITPDMRTCQETVHMFYQAQKVALEQISRLCSEKQHFTRQIDFLSNEIRAQRDDVMQMKGELKATCRKDVPKLTLPTGNLNSNPSGLHLREFQSYRNDLLSSPRNGFVPLLSSEKS